VANLSFESIPLCSLLFLVHFFSLPLIPFPTLFNSLLLYSLFSFTLIFFHSASCTIFQKLHLSSLSIPQFSYLFSFFLCLSLSSLFLSLCLSSSPLLFLLIYFCQFLPLSLCSSIHPLLLFLLFVYFSLYLYFGLHPLKITTKRKRGHLRLCCGLMYNH
jgi:hypothetical protein